MGPSSQLMAIAAGLELASDIGRHALEDSIGLVKFQVIGFSSAAQVYIVEFEWITNLDWIQCTGSESFKQKLDSVPDQTSSEEQMENWSKAIRNAVYLGKKEELDIAWVCVQKNLRDMWRGRVLFTCVAELISVFHVCCAFSIELTVC
ncbi:hypothetical protein Q9233_009726 [Columba guinea]|nr:hypothetical protein Q9233_009726 [Columba guinea]